METNPVQRGHMDQGERCCQAPSPALQGVTIVTAASSQQEAGRAGQSPSGTLATRSTSPHHPSHQVSSSISCFPELALYTISRTDTPILLRSKLRPREGETFPKTHS